MQEINDKYCRTCLRKMLNRSIIGGKHQREHYITGFVAKVANSKEYKVFQKEWETLISEEYVIRAKKTGEDHVWLNPRKLSELKQLVLGK